MSNIFISYKQEKQDEARLLATALEQHGWHVWWDPTFRKNENDDVFIQMARETAKCIIVLWSSNSVKSYFVKDDAAYAFDHDKLISVIIEKVKLPCSFSKIKTHQLINWDGSTDNQEFFNLAEDISKIVGRPAMKTHEKKVPFDFQDDLKDGSMGPEMIIIQCEKPQKAFALSQYLITFEQYDIFAKNINKKFPNDNSWGRGKQPVIDVSWDEAKSYAEWLTEQTKRHYRLPSEAEWEYAASCGEKKEKWAGTSIETELGNYAWFDQNSGKRTHPVGMKKPNAFGLYDMSGNVWEWIDDCRDKEGYEAERRDGSVSQSNSENCEPRVLRGGACDYGADSARSANRRLYIPDQCFPALNRSIYNLYGFRLACDLD